ncbi:MoaD/ThiS family protein [Candidatus Bathyarchaeota archaeon]|nr:MoaD/ThiS family protein [Candidatus Bathyarchaeota archaeon]
MKILVRVFGDISDDIGKRYDFEIIDKISVYEIIEKISALSGQRRGYLGTFRIDGKDLGFLVNGKNIEFLEGLKTILNDGDELIIMQPTTGG